MAAWRPAEREIGAMDRDEALKLLFDEHRAKKLRENIGALARPSATEDIVDEIEGLIRGARGVV